MNEWDRWSIPAEAEIISLFGLLFAFFARDIRVCFTKGINKFGFMVRRNIQGLQGRTRNGDGKIGLQHYYKEWCYDYADWVWVGAGVKTNFLYFFYSFGDRIWFYLVHCVLAIVC